MIVMANRANKKIEIRLAEGAKLASEMQSFSTFTSINTEKNDISRGEDIEQGEKALQPNFISKIIFKKVIKSP